MGEDADDGGKWKTIAKVTAVVLLAVILLAGLPFVAGTLAGEAEIPWWVGPVGILLGVGAFYLGFRSYRKRQLVRDTPTSKVRSLAIGTTEVQGQAHPLAEPVISPLTHTPACMFAFTVEEEKTVEKTTRDSQGRTRTKREKEWRTVLTIEESVPFCIDDGTGRVPVRAEDAKLDIALEEEIEVGKGQSPPEALGVWAEEHDSREQPDIRLPGRLGEMVEAVRSGELDPEEMEPEDVYPEGFDPNSDDPSQLNPDDVKLASILYGQRDDEPQPRGSSRAGSGGGSMLGTVKNLVATGKDIAEAASTMGASSRYLTQSTRNKRRFEERVLAAEESTYVFGCARRLPEADSIENVENLVLCDDPTTGQFLVSDKSPDRLLDEELVRSAMGLGAGAVLIPYGVVAALVWAGLV